MKQTVPHALYDISDMRCSHCGKPFDVSVMENEAGEFETYLQCFTCHYSIKLNSYKPRPKEATLH